MNSTITAVTDNISPAYSPYFYVPSFPASVAAAVTFGLVALLLLIQIARCGSSIALVLWFGFISEAAGYVIRTISVRNLTNINLYMAQYIIILVSPSLIAAGCFIIFSRLVWFITPKDYLNFSGLWMHPRAIGPVFVLFDLVAFVTQLVGCGFVASALKSNTNVTPDQMLVNIYNGNLIIKVGVLVQLVCFAVFAILATRFYVISRDWKEHGEYADKLNRWRRVNMAVNISALLLLIRGIYRVVDFSGNLQTNSYIMTNEWVFWVFEAAPIYWAMVLLTFLFIGVYIPPHFCRWTLNKELLMAVKEEEAYSGMLPGRISPPRGSLVSSNGGYGGMSYAKGISGRRSI